MMTNPATRQIAREELGADQLDDARQDVAAAIAAHDRSDPGGPQEQRRQIDERQEVAPALAARPAVGPFGKDERKVDEERRQEQHRHHVAPVEHPVGIEPPAERERETPKNATESQRSSVAWLRPRRTPVPTSSENSPTLASASEPMCLTECLHGQDQSEFSPATT
jgi:hypothetical protein